MIQVNQSILSVVITGLERNSTYGVRLTGLTKVRGWIRNGVLGPTHNITTKYGEEKLFNLIWFLLKTVQVESVQNNQYENYYLGKLCGISLDT